MTRLKLISQALRLLLVMSILLLCFTSVARAETESESQTSTGTSTYGTQQSVRFAMVPSPSIGAGYPRGNGSAAIVAMGAYLSVHLEARGMAKSAHLTLVLLANGTPRSVAIMTATYVGSVEAEATVSLPSGSYSVGLQVLDTSTFSSPTQVLVSSPGTQLVSLVQSTQVSQTSTFVATTTASTVHEDESEDGYIRSAIQTKVIPAVVDVSESGSNAFVNDGNFSVSVGKYQEDGYLVSISAANIVGLRVVMVNLTSTQARNLFSGPFQVALDGSNIPQASVLSQVLAATSGDPAQFVIISGPAALKLLVLIPHFSYHTITIVPILVHAGAELLIYVPALLFSVAAVTLITMAAYSRRMRLDL